RIRAVGSIKYDPNGRDHRAEAQENTRTTSVSDADRQRPVLFGGSTHRGEEEILARVFLRLRQQFSSLRLFIAPRHVERLREIRAQLAALPLRVAVPRKGAVQGRDASSLEMTIAGLLRDGDARERLLENALDVLSKHYGATARAAALIHRFHSSL